MKKRSALAAGVAAAAAGAGVVLARRALQDDDQRERFRRRRRVWKLTARRGLNFGLVKLRGTGASAEKRAQLEKGFAIQSAEDVARELGNMKGAIMKAGQFMSFMVEGLPSEAQAMLATLQSNVEPMAPRLAEQVVHDELGADVGKLFLDWETAPVAAASIGQVHRAVLHDGRMVAVKVQYPGVDRAIKGDLDNFEQLMAPTASLVMKGVDVHGVVNELRLRMADELDYRLEAQCQAEFAARFRTHPFIRVPDVVAERSSQRVLTSEWVDGDDFAAFEAKATAAQKRHAGEVIFRFAHGSIARHRVFNGDPHPGNYRFHDDGTITFLDFGLVKRWVPGELEELSPVLDAVLAKDPAGTVQAAVAAGFLPPQSGLDPQHVWDVFAAPYKAFLADTFTFDRHYVSEAIGATADINGPYKDVIRAFKFPPSFVILNRVVWGVSALLGRLGASGPYRGILAEYRHDGPPVTELGEREALWWARVASDNGAPNVRAR